jgi:RsiW-degrading membrane proteinase PrsW (M82 family)
MLTLDLEIIGIYAAAALLPCIFLLVYIYRLDDIEREPSSLLLKLLLGGVAAAFVAMLLEYFFTQDVDGSNASFGTVVWNALLVGVFEEGSKFFFLKKISWKNPAFNYRFDGLVYAVFISLGFAALENVLYVFLYDGLSVALPRALLSIPGHMSFGAVMGIYYSRAKICERVGDDSGKNLLLLAGLLLAIVFHTVFDSTLMIGSTNSILVFVFVVLLVYFLIFIRVRHEAATDRPIQ